MIKKIIIFVVLGLSILLLQGCTEVKVDTGEAIVPPRNKYIPIQGTWTVESWTKANGDKGELQNPLVGKQAAFDEKIALLGNELCENPEYKIRSVKSADYFLYTYQIPYKRIGDMEPIIEVVSVTTAKGQHFYDFIIVDEQQLIVHRDDTFLNLKYVSSDVNVNLIDKDDEKTGGSDPEIPRVESSLLRSGVLLGLGSSGPGNSSNAEDPRWNGEPMSYRTLWIAAKNRQIYSIEEVENLLVPRKSGFWIVQSERINNDGRALDYFIAKPLETGTERTQKTGALLQPQDEKQRNDESKEESMVLPIDIFKRIRFIGNDYAAIEYSQSRAFKGNVKNNLQLMPIDHMNNGQGINISDIGGEGAKEILLNSAQGYVNNLNRNEMSKMEEVREDRFTLERRNGHWLMKGRLYYSNHEEVPYLEYSINMIPPEKIVNYDELHVSWNKIKEKVPEAIDAFVSPNKDMAIIIADKCIYIYSLINEEFGEKPLEKIQLQEGEVVVMAEWATGNYVEKWKNFIIENVRTKLELSD